MGRVTSFKFDKLIPPAEDTQDGIENFLALTENDKTSKLDHSSHQESSTAIIHMAISKDPCL